MPNLQPLLLYIFYPNPGNATYGSTSMLTFLALSLVLLVLAITIRSWRAGLQSPATKRLSRSWSATSFWFGIIGLILVVSRVEKIQFLAMRFLWVLWGLSLLVYIAFQIRQFHARNYQVLPSQRFSDPREKYLPGRKRS
ncbi:MAG: hypothetical protein WCV62_06795 [Candidatus Peribacteraceae bacterium]